MAAVEPNALHVQSKKALTQFESSSTMLQRTRWTLSCNFPERVKSLIIPWIWSSWTKSFYGFLSFVYKVIFWAQNDEFKIYALVQLIIDILDKIGLL